MFGSTELLLLYRQKCRPCQNKQIKILRCIKTLQTSRIDKINVWNRWVSLGLKALLEPGAAKFERLFDSAQIERNRCKKIQKRNEYSACCRKSLIISARCGRQKTGQIPLNNAAACNRAEQMQEKSKKRNVSAACCPKSLLEIISDRCGRQKTGQMPLKNAAACDRAEQMNDKSRKETLLSVVATAR